MNPIDHDSYEAVAVLNYFSFPMEVNEDGYKSFVRKEMGFSKDDSYPILLIDSSSEEMPSVELSEKENILSFLFNKQIIGSYKQHSAYEK